MWSKSRDSEHLFDCGLRFRFELMSVTQKSVQFDHVQLKVMNETIDIKEMAHQHHQAVSCNTEKYLL